MEKIIIPTALREDYLLTLRKLTRLRQPISFIKMMAQIHKFSASITGENMLEMQELLKESNAFLESNEGKLKIT